MTQGCILKNSVSYSICSIAGSHPLHTPVATHPHAVRPVLNLGCCMPPLTLPHHEGLMHEPQRS